MFLAPLWAIKVVIIPKARNVVGVIIKGLLKQPLLMIDRLPGLMPFMLLCDFLLELFVRLFVRLGHFALLPIPMLLAFLVKVLVFHWRVRVPPLQLRSVKVLEELLLVRFGLASCHLACLLSQGRLLYREVLHHDEPGIELRDLEEVPVDLLQVLDEHPDMPLYQGLRMLLPELHDLDLVRNRATSIVDGRTDGHRLKDRVLHADKAVLVQYALIARVDQGGGSDEGQQ